ncbi:MAG: MMPL family transporter [Thermomicrobiales bacterium]|nr:MMPL family transporter [Thermomicrobiales bacterium]
MTMRHFLSASYLTRKSAEHPRRTIGIWLAILVAAICLMVTLLGDALSTDVTTLTNNPESARADRLLQERLGGDSANFGEIIVITSPTMTVDDVAYQQFVEQLHEGLIALGDQIVIGASDYWSTGDESLVSADRHTVLLPLTLPDSATESIDRIHQVVDDAGSVGDFALLVTGEATLDKEITEAAERDLAKGEAIGISLALVILALVFGAVVAAFLPIVLAIAAIVVSLGATALLGQFIDLPVVVINLMTMLGLAVGIDYSLFVVSRFREERANGRETVDAIAASGATAGRTVVISGLTVAAALAGMLIMPDTSNRAIGAGAVLIVLATVLASLTLLPALLSILGDRVNALRIPLPTRRQVSATSSTDGGFWDWTTRAVMRRPVVSLILAGGLLLAAASAIIDMEQGEIGISAMPDGFMSKEAYTILEQEFGFGQDLPAIVVIDGVTGDGVVQTATAALQQSIATDPSFSSSQLETHPDANLMVLSVRLSGDALSNEAMDAVVRLRAELIPAAVDDAPAEVLVTGKTAMTVDLTDASNTYMPIVFVFVLGLSFVVLTVAFRSIVVPVKAILMNLLSVAAAYGLLVLVFQKGVGASFFGFQQVEVIQTGLPLFLFAVLFGLSMDYHVFLLSRIRERFLETGDNTEAVAHGLRSTGRLITGAALIMVAVFGGFALGDLVPMQQMGFGLAVAVLVDATIIRCVLVPASMQLLGDWNWYLPNFLTWLPNVQLEPGIPAVSQGSGD